MFRTKNISRQKPSLVNFFCGTNLVRSAKSDRSSETLSFSKKKEKNDDPERKEPVVDNNNNKSHSAKKLYTNVCSDEEKKKGREKLRDLISDINETKNEAITTGKTVSVTQANKRKKAGEPSKFDFEKSLIKSAEKVAETFGGRESAVKSDLLESLSLFAISKEKNMDFQPFPHASSITRTPIQKGKTIIKLGDKEQTEPLGIFKKWDQHEESSTQVKLMIWNQLGEEELKFLALAPPRNYFEELIMWTEQGKLWHFPINNHQGMEEEAETNFTEHIFLENHLEPWCPKKGPLRHFMDLVLVGLSKNYVLTVQDKKEHIYWFRDYFESKKKLLKELGALTTTKKVEKEK